MALKLSFKYITSKNGLLFFTINLFHVVYLRVQFSVRRFSLDLSLVKELITIDCGI